MFLTRNTSYLMRNIFSAEPVLKKHNGTLITTLKSAFQSIKASACVFVFLALYWLQCHISTFLKPKESLADGLLRIAFFVVLWGLSRPYGTHWDPLRTLVDTYRLSFHSCSWQLLNASKSKEKSLMDEDDGLSDSFLLYQRIQDFLFLPWP